MARRRLYDFVRLAWPILKPNERFQDNWHIGCICEHLQALTELQITKLVINVPPRHGKSFLTSVFWFCWVWLRDPSDQFIFASYDRKLAERDSMRCRDLIRSTWYREEFETNWEIKADADAKNLFINTLGGQRVSTTPESWGTGIDANYIVADDPTKIADGRRPRKLEVANEWWTGSMSTRGVDPDKLRRCIIQQRCAVNDLSGYVTSDALGYEHLVLPFEYEPRRVCFSREEAKLKHVKDPIILTKVQRENPSTRDPRREPGEILWRGRFAPGTVREWKAHLKAVGIAGQLQQRPGAQGGNLFQSDLFRYFSVGPDNRYPGKTCVHLHSAGRDEVFPIDAIRFFQATDTALTVKRESSFTVVSTFALTPRSDLLVWHVWREKLEVPYQYPAMKEMLIGPIHWNGDLKKFLRTGKWLKSPMFNAVEAKASGQGIIDLARADGLPIKAIEVDGNDGDKTERAVPVATLLGQGKVYFRKGAPWLADFEDELILFPRGNHDDQVDTLSHAGYLVQHDRILRSFLKEELLIPDISQRDGARIVDGRGESFEFRTGDGGSVQIHFGD